MKRVAYTVLGLLLAASAHAGTDHYLRTAGSHVQHLKIITQKNGDKQVSMDVDFEPGEGDKDAHACSVDISGEAKKVSDTELVLRKQSESERRYCTLTINLQGEAASVKQSEDCSYFLGHFCKFDSEGDTLKKVR